MKLNFLKNNEKKTILNKSDNKKTREKSTGRSMVEMLGVLAIIGVLSIGGIQGYTIAMRRYRANEIASLMTKFASIQFFNLQNMINNDPNSVIVENYYPVYLCKDGNDYFYDACPYSNISFTNVGLGGLPVGVTDIELFGFLAPADSSGSTSYYDTEKIKPANYAEMRIHFEDVTLCRTLSNLLLINASDSMDRCDSDYYLSRLIPVD